MMYYIVWNEDKTEGFATTDKKLAYEVRKSSESNCFDENGRQSHVGQEFCEQWWEGNCTTETVNETPDVNPGITVDK